MRRLILDAMPDAEGRFRLEGSDARYLTRVLRLRPGASFRALLPDGREARAEIESVGKDALRAVLRADAPEDGSERSDRARRGALPRIASFALIQALPKAQKMDLIVRQAAEAGVSLIIPFVAERSVSRPEAGREGERKKERWERIVKEARQQSGSDAATEVLEPGTLAEGLSAWRTFAGEGVRSVGIFLHQDPLAQGSFHGYLSGDPRAVALAIGPEGGFSASEAERLRAEGFLPALLGENVLRTETAAVFALAAAQVVLLEKESWIPKTPRSPESNA